MSDSQADVHFRTERGPGWITLNRPRAISALAREAGREVNLDGMSKADASRLIDELQDASGRGAGH